MKERQLGFFLLLLGLSLGVVFVDYTFFLTPPKIVTIQAYGEETEIFQEYGEEYMDTWTIVEITDHPLKPRILKYINLSVSIDGGRVYVADSKVADLFSQYYEGPWMCGNAMYHFSPRFKDGEDYYLVIIGQKLSFNLLSQFGAGLVTLTTIILWISTVFYAWKDSKNGP